MALTFDAGADRGNTELILDTLQNEGIAASFGITGEWVQKNQDLTRRIAGDGHLLINHSWSHRSFTGHSTGARALSTTERRIELERTAELIEGITGRSTRPYFRPPYGDLDARVLRDVSEVGYDYTIMWTVDSLGWQRQPLQGILDRCLAQASSGVIYVLHVGADSDDAQAVGPMIEGLRTRNFECVTIAEMLGL